MLSFVGKHISFYSKDVYSFSVFKWKGVKPTSISNKIIKYVDMFKKHRQDCEHPKNAQFDIYAITSNFLSKFQWKFAKNLIIMKQIWPQKFFSWKSKLLKKIDKKVILLLRYQFSCFIKDFSYSEAGILFFVNIWGQKWHQTKEVTIFQERYRITK